MGMDCRPRILFRKGIMPRVTIGASSHVLGVPSGHDLAVVSLVITLDRLGREFVPAGHLYVPVARLAFAGIGFSGPCLCTLRG